MSAAYNVPQPAQESFNRAAIPALALLAGVIWWFCCKPKGSRNFFAELYTDHLVPLMFPLVLTANRARRTTTQLHRLYATVTRTGNGGRDCHKNRPLHQQVARLKRVTCWWRSPQCP